MAEIQPRHVHTAFDELANTVTGGGSRSKCAYDLRASVRRRRPGESGPSMSLRPCASGM
ncbi:hypothetical protein Pd630_LPD03631 [Rhodococcus opacus PD630]|nr:hypothetical protein Pd630_LPD03631 [Rhodococcus opacus PD630]